MAMLPELIVFDFCPYCQRVRIVLEHSGLPHKLTRLEPANIPAWFNEVSPLGKVPLLRVVGESIFESSVIVELADQLSGANLLPREIVARGWAKAWFEFAATCQMNFTAMLRAESARAFTSAKGELRRNLAHVEEVLDPVGPYFLGKRFSLVDAAYAPLLARMRYLDERVPCQPETLPRVRRWTEVLAALPAVDRSVDGDLPGVFRQMVAHLGLNGHVANCLAGRQEDTVPDKGG
jgi:glutathione S-transferase